jgi:hypothetical protein
MAIDERERSAKSARKVIGKIREFLINVSNPLNEDVREL